MTTSDGAMEEKFEEYRNRLLNELIWADRHLLIWKHLQGYGDKNAYLKELNQAPFFFHCTVVAQIDASLVHIFKLVDTHRDALSIWKLLNFVEQNMTIFSKEAFTSRMAGAGRPESVRAYERIDAREVAEDRNRLEAHGDTLKRLEKWRHKAYAHMDSKIKNIGKAYPIQTDELEKLIVSLHEIVNRYALVYSRESWVSPQEADDDSGLVMQAIRLRVAVEAKLFELFAKEEQTLQLTRQELGELLR